jgi:hypothetical protein
MTRSEEICQQLGLIPHPEGGFYREWWRSDRNVQHPAGDLRPAMTAIYYVLRAGDFSAWHSVRSEETWVLLEGGPLEFHLLTDAGEHSIVRLAQDGVRHVVAPADTLMAAEPARGAEFVLVACHVAPGFDFADFLLPTRAELLERHPTHEMLVVRFTRLSAAD